MPESKEGKCQSCGNPLNTILEVSLCDKCFAMVIDSGTIKTIDTV